jgi:hypothetical protein
MPSVTYTAKRGLISGHTVDASYSLDLSLALNAEEYNPVTHHNVSIGGSRQVWFEREEVNFNCRTIPLSGADRDAFLEFIRSVGDGQTFTYDPYGTIASPDNPQSAKLIGKPKPQLVDGSGPFFSYTFKIVIA